jgi:hypothetical protein
MSTSRAAIVDAVTAALRAMQANTSHRSTDCESGDAKPQSRGDDCIHLTKRSNDGVHQPNLGPGFSTEGSGSLPKRPKQYMDRCDSRNSVGTTISYSGCATCTAMPSNLVSAMDTDSIPTVPPLTQQMDGRSCRVRSSSSLASASSASSAITFCNVENQLGSGNFARNGNAWDYSELVKKGTSRSSDDEERSPRSVLSFQEKGEDSPCCPISNAQIAVFVAGYMKILSQMIPTPLPAPNPKDIWMELATANHSIARQGLPDDIPFAPVHPECALLPMATHCGIPPIAVALGASYFQRLTVAYPAVRAAAKKAGWFVQVPCSIVLASNNGQQRQDGSTGCKKSGRVLASSISGNGIAVPMEVDSLSPGTLVTVMRAVPGRGTASILAIYLACIYLGCKVADRVQYKGLLSAMLSALLRREVPTQESVGLEAQCLQRLDFRLGPYYMST